ncbi:MAG: CopG family transcriptional regulator [Thiotrichales bacterium]
MRTIVDLPEDQLKALSGLGERERLSRAELIRQAIAEYLERRGPAVSDEAFGLWAGRGEDGVAYESRVRSEWEQ